MGVPRRITDREWVFMRSLRLYGYRYQKRRHNLRFGRGYCIPSTRREDAWGIDFFIKPPHTHALLPVQITQLGIRIQLQYGKKSVEAIRTCIKERVQRLRERRALCRRTDVLFVCVKDYLGTDTNNSVAASDHARFERAITRHQSIQRAG